MSFPPTTHWPKLVICLLPTAKRGYPPTSREREESQMERSFRCLCVGQEARPKKWECQESCLEWSCLGASVGMDEDNLHCKLCHCLWSHVSGRRCPIGLTGFWLFPSFLGSWARDGRWQWVKVRFKGTRVAAAQGMNMRYLLNSKNTHLNWEELGGFFSLCSLNKLWRIYCTLF